jgi:hypothetical protein
MACCREQKERKALMNPITLWVTGRTESRMTDAEAVYTAQEAADKLEKSLIVIRMHLDGIDQIPFGDVSKCLDDAMRSLNEADGFHAQVKSALSKIKMRETADV